MEIAITLLCFTGSKIQTAAVANKEWTENDIPDIMIFIKDGSAESHAVDFSLVITGDTNHFVEYIIGFDQAADCLLQILQFGADFHDVYFGGQQPLMWN